MPIVFKPLCVVEALSQNYRCQRDRSRGVKADARLGKGASIRASLALQRTRNDAVPRQEGLAEVVRLRGSGPLSWQCNGPRQAAPRASALSRWRGSASPRSGDPGGQRPRRQPARSACVGRAERSTAGEVSEAWASRTPHRREGVWPVRAWLPEGRSRQPGGRRGSVDGRHQSAAPCQVPCPTRACT